MATIERRHNVTKKQIAQWKEPNNGFWHGIELVSTGPERDNTAHLYADVKVPSRTEVMLVSALMGSLGTVLGIGFVALSHYL